MKVVIQFIYLSYKYDLPLINFLNEILQRPYKKNTPVVIQVKSNNKNNLSDITYQK